jgi:DNA-binding transcriptional LysR family regulator
MAFSNQSIQQIVIVISFYKSEWLVMTLEQLRIFVAVAERQHVTRAAEALNITQSAVSAAIAALEARHDIRLFDRVGRGIVLNDVGRALLSDARVTLAHAAGLDHMLAGFRGLERGSLRIGASQTVGGYWLPRLLGKFRKRYPGIALTLDIANSERVAEQVAAGEVELGFVEGVIDDPGLLRWPIAEDRLLAVQAGTAPSRIDADWVRSTDWVLREAGSGTRSTFEAVLAGMGVDPAELKVALVLPSNEAVRSAVIAGAGAAVLSTVVVTSALSAGHLLALRLDVPPRRFFGLRHRERQPSRAAQAFLELVTATA